MSERRVRRSNDAATALSLLLASQRERAGLGALILSTQEGIVLAYDGDRDACEELAAYAPFVARGGGLSVDPRRLVGVTVHSFPTGTQDLLLVLQGETSPERLATTVHGAIEGALRILAA